MVATAKFPIPMTVAEYMQRGEDEPRAELVDGEIVLSPEPIWIHQRIAKRITRQLDTVAEEKNLGEWFLPLNVVMSPNTLLHPDLVFIGAGSGLDPKSPLVEQKPLIVVEVLSPSNRRHDLIYKRSRYADRGILEYWIADPEATSLTILLRNEQGVYDGFEVVGDQIPVGLFKGASFDLAWVFSKVAP